MADLKDLLPGVIGDFIGPNCPLHAQAKLGKLSESNVMHMLGHAIDWHVRETSDAGFPEISIEGIEQEFQYVFNDLTNPFLNEARRTDPDALPEDDPRFQGSRPEAWGCFGGEARSELVAEAIRAYMQNPNYLKTVAPNVARQIRAAVNEHPFISRIIQFN